MRLYEITENIRGLQDLADSGELTAEDIKDTMDGLNIEFEKKAEAALKVRQSMLAQVDAINNEIDRLINLKKSPEKNAVWLSEYVKQNMLAMDKSKLDLGVFKVSIRKASLKLGDIDESKIDDIFFTHIPASKKLDKRALLKEAKKNPLSGVELVNSEQTLTIK